MNGRNRSRTQRKPTASSTYQVTRHGQRSTRYDRRTARHTSP